VKLSKSFQSLLIGSAFLLSADAFAANKGTLHVSAPETIAGERLKAGDYTVRWEGTGPDVQLRIMRGAKVIATSSARLISLESAPTSDSVVVTSDGHGNLILSQIFFSGQRTALQVEELSTTAGMSSSH
jgi:hypothetical protein